MKYCKNYCEENGISTSELNEAQRTLYYIAENMKMDKSISEEGYRHFQMAIKALEQEPSDDCVSRANLISKLEILDRRYGSDFYWETRKIVDKLPSVKPQEKTGHWSRVTDKTGHLVWECDKCGWQQRFNTNFCPDCGAKMD